MSELAMDEVASQGSSAGELLRRYREAAGLHVDTLAASLKVPVRKLQALEQDQHDQLTDAVFARALASSVCRALKVDAQPVLERLPQTHAPRLVQDHEGLNAPFRAPGDGAAPGWTDQLTKPVFLVVYALLLGALVLVFLPKSHTDTVAAKPADTAPSPMTSAALVPVTSADQAPAAVSPDTLPVQQPSTPGPVAAAATAAEPAHTPGVVAAPTAAATPVSSASRTATAAAAAVSSAAVAAPAAAAPAPAPNGLVVFRTTGPSWIEVTDSRGTTTLRRLMAAGEAAGASGTLPLAVTIGSVSATTVQVRGKPFELARFSRDNVARFEVK